MAFQLEIHQVVTDLGKPFAGEALPKVVSARIRKETSGRDSRVESSVRQAASWLAEQQRSAPTAA